MSITTGPNSQRAEDAPRPPTGYLSLLQPINGARMGKSFCRRLDGTLAEIPYPNARNFTYQRVEFTDFASFVMALEKAAAIGQVVIHGKRCGDHARGIVNRRKHADPLTGEAACFCEDPDGNTWVMVDIDDLPNEWCEHPPADARAVRALTYAVVCTLLPPEFHRAFYWFQWSNSMGVKCGWETLKLHLWFMLARPVTETVLDQWAASIRTIDPCVFRTVQCNYIASPTFTGMTDPLGDWRSGAVTEFGDHEAVDFNYTYVEPQAFRQRSDALIRLQQELWRQEGKKFRALDPERASAPMRIIAEIGVGGHCYQAIVASAASWVRSCGSNPDYGAWSALVRERVTISGSARASSYTSERTLTLIWRSALQKYSPINPNNPPVPRELLINQNFFNRPKS